MMKSLLFTLFLTSIYAHADDLCSDVSDGSTYQLLTKVIKVGQNQVYVCGGASNPANDLSKDVHNFAVVTSSAGKNAKGKKVRHQSDDAFKSYAIKELKNGFSIDEYLDGNSPKNLNPFIRILVNCDQKSCRTQEVCVWKKNPLATLPKKFSAVDIFYRALNGDPEALNYYQSKKSRFTKNDEDDQNVEDSELDGTLKDDIKRLKKAGCIK